jgi:hypothetical protein
MRKSPVAFFTALLIVGLSVAIQGPVRGQVLHEGFDDITTLTGKGYVFINNSNPPPPAPDDWFQGNHLVFESQAGAPDAYIGADFLSVGDTDPPTGTISNWLLTPEMEFANGGTIQFWTRTTTADFPDRLEVRLSLNGSSTNVGTTETSVGDFTTNLLTINPNLLPGSDNYPTDWTLFTVSLSGLPATPTTGRVGFRYFVTDVGSSGTNGDYIGVDTLTINGTGVVAPEPGVICLLLPGLAGLRMVSQRRDRVRARLRAE